MATSTLIVDYLGADVAASRPASPNVPTGGTAIYYATDTGAVSIWDGTAWIVIGVIAPIGSNEVYANLTGGSAVPLGNTLTAIFDAVLSATQGSVIFRNATDWVALGPGTSGDVLTTGGPGADAAWAAGGGGGGGTPPTVRGSNIQASSAATYNVNFPSGTIAGDLAVLFIGSAFPISAVPSGWTQIDAEGTANWLGATLIKRLTSGDITTGHVTVNMTGTFASTLAIVTFAGGTGGVVAAVSFQVGAAGTAFERLSYPSFNPGVSYFSFATSRANQTIVIAEGTQLQTVNNGSGGSGVLNEQVPSGSPLTLGYASATYPGATNAGAYQIILGVLGP